MSTVGVKHVLEAYTPAFAGLCTSMCATSCWSDSLPMVMSEGACSTFLNVGFSATFFGDWGSSCAQNLSGSLSQWLVQSSTILPCWLRGDAALSGNGRMSGEDGLQPLAAGTVSQAGLSFGSEHRIAKGFSGYETTHLMYSPPSQTNRKEIIALQHHAACATFPCDLQYPTSWDFDGWSIPIFWGVWWTMNSSWSAHA